MFSFKFKKRLKIAAWFSLPFLMLGGSFIWQAWQDLDQLKHLLKDKTPITFGHLVLRLQDLWQQEVHSFLPHPPERERHLQVLDLQVSERELPLLLQSGKHPFVSVELGFADLRFKGEVRLRGYKPWHIAETKKSLRLKLKKGDFILGHREWNLNNPDRPVLFEEKWVFDMAQALGLMTPQADFLRLRFNGLDQGVFALVAPLDEHVLRQHHRFPGDLYRLENRQTGWLNSKDWHYESWYDAEQKQFQNLSRLLERIQHAPDSAFSAFALTHLNLRAFAVLEILTQIFAEQDADPELNNALYFDPYRGQWEPVLFEFTGLGLGSAPPADPLFERLAKIPAYQHLRLELYRTMASQWLQPSQLQAKGQALIQQLIPDLAADPFWRARGLQPVEDDFSQILMRPMQLTQLHAAFQTRLAAIAVRRQHLEGLWRLPARTALSSQGPKPIQKWGPGTLRMIKTTVIPADQPVQIAPGTTILLGPQVSLIFHGPVWFQGQKHRPIRLLPMGSQPWGGLVLQGPATSGSLLRGLEIRGGSFPHHSETLYPGMINLHHTAGIQIQDAHFADHRGSDDVLHTAYVQNLKAENVLIQNAASDGWDLEFTQAQIHNLRIQQTGDDGLDLMDSDIQLSQAVIHQSQGNALSAGEISRVRVQDSLLANSGTGVLAKNGAQVSLRGSVLFQNRKGIEIYQESPHYARYSTVSGHQLYITGTGQALALDGVSHKRIRPPAFSQGDVQRGPLSNWLKGELQ